MSPLLLFFSLLLLSSMATSDDETLSKKSTSNLSTGMLSTTIQGVQDLLGLGMASQKTSLAAQLKTKWLAPAGNFIEKHQKLMKFGLFSSVAGFLYGAHTTTLTTATILSLLLTSRNAISIAKRIKHSVTIQGELDAQTTEDLQHKAQVTRSKIEKLKALRTEFSSQDPSKH